MAAPVWAAGTATVRAGAHSDLDRIVVDWTESTDYKLSGDAPNYQVSFASAASPGLPDVSTLRRVESLTTTNTDPLVLSIQLKPGNSLHAWRTGNRIVLDAVTDKKTNTTTTAAPAAPTPAAPPAKETAENKAAAQIKSEINAAIKAAPWSENQDTGGPAPTASDVKPAVAPSPPPTSAPPPKPAAANDVPQGDVGPGGRPLTLAELAARDAAKQAQQAKDQAAAAQNKPATPADKDKPADETQDFQPLPTQLPDAVAVAQIKLKVPKDVKLAAYLRGQKFWIVLNQPNLASPTDENDGDPTKFGPVTRYEVGQGTGTAYRIQLSEHQFPALTKSDNDTLLFTIYQQAPLVMPVGLPIEIQNSPDAGAELRIAGKHFSTPLRVSDPDIGDHVFVIPASADAGAVTEMHRWPQLETLPALNGIVINPLVDNILVDADKTGATIARPPKGLALSGVQGIIRNRDQNVGEQIYDLNHWRIGTFEKYRGLKAQLESALTDIHGPERLERIMQIARFMFAQGYGAEANGWLNIAKQEFPDADTIPEYILLRGAVRVTMHDVFSADRDLALQGYGFEPEIALWRGWAAAQHEDYSRARYFFSLASTLLNDYPDPYFRPIGLAAAETALLTGDAIAGGALISRLETHKELTDADKGELDYLRGLKAHLDGHEDEAVDLWKKAAKSKNEMYAAKSQLLIAQSEIKQKDGDKKDAVNRLERLRFSWRGDRTELATLVTLADYYIANNNPRRAFESWQTIIHYFPADSLAETARQNISKNFTSLFAPDQQNALAPIEALALYQDFINYAPTPESREQITRQLIDKLVGVGMYHEAAAIYAPLLQPKPLDSTPANPDAAQPVNATDALHLAGIYLLDNQSQAARDTLALTPLNGLPTAQQTEYRLLFARADFQDGKFDDAIQQLAPITDTNAERLRADIYWHQQKWADAAKVLPELIGNVAPADKLTPDQAKLILQQAVALNLANQAADLDALREKYSAQMDATDLAASFRLITRPPKGSEIQSVTSIQSRIGEVDSFGTFLQNYSKSVSQKPADAASPPAPAAAPADAAKK